MKKILIISIITPIILVALFIYQVHTMDMERMTAQQKQNNPALEKEVLSLQEINLLAQEMNFETADTIIYLQLNRDQVAWR